MAVHNAAMTKKAALNIVIALSLFMAFCQFGRLNLMTAGNWTLDLVRYQEAARYHDWNTVISQTNDPIVKETYADKNRATQDLGLFSFINIVPYFLYTFLHVKGVALWLSQKLLLSLMGVGVSLFVFLLADIFYGPAVGLIAAVLVIFSPHFWISFNVDSAFLRSYNIFLSLASVYAFIRLCEARVVRKRWLIAVGVIWGLNFDFFHIGSFMMPLVILVYFLLDRDPQRLGRGGRGFKLFFQTLGLGLAMALALQMCRLWWFHLPLATPMDWLKGYLAKGPEASHSASGIVIGHLGTLLANIKDHVMGVFVNGKTPADWHYAISPPGIAYSYSPVITLFFILGVFFACRERRKGDAFFLVWFLLFFLVYGFLIVVRQKNIAWEIPALFILAARALLSLGNKVKSFLITNLHQHPARQYNVVRALAALLVIPALIQGSFFITVFLPQKNFYDNAAFSGTYQLYRYLATQGYTRKTKIMFSMPTATVGPIMMRLFSDGIMPASALSQQGVPYPTTDENWKMFEQTHLPDCDKIMYCFMYFDNHAGNVVYVTDDQFRLILEQMHPGVKPFVIRGLDGNPLWRVYKIKPSEAAIPQEQNTQESAVEEKNLAPELFSDLLIGSTFKTLAKAYVATLNMENFKKNNAKLLDKMNDGKFEKKIRMVMPYLKYLPKELKQRCGIKDVMTRHDAKEGLHRLTKPMLAEIVEAIPDKVIADAFREHEESLDSSTDKKNVVGQINEIWDKAMTNSKQIQSAP